MIGPKEKKERALGEHLHLKGERCNSPKCALVRKPYRPGVHGRSRKRRNLSDFGRQLQEKQKFKYTYGLDDRGFEKLFRIAQKKRGATSAKFLELLERRLDNVVFRLGLAASRGQARQYIVHGHIMVNQRRVRSPGFSVSTGDRISLRPESKTHQTFRPLAEILKKYETPPWLNLNRDAFEGEVVSLPQDVTTPFDVNLLVESFSK